MIHFIKVKTTKADKGQKPGCKQSPKGAKAKSKIPSKNTNKVQKDRDKRHGKAGTKAHGVTRNELAKTEGSTDLSTQGN